MGIENYLNLLHSLSSSALTIWGFLISVSLGMVAFLGSVKSLKIPLSIVLCFLFLGFALSNFTALKRNYEQRISIIKTMENISDTEFQKDLKSNYLIIEKFEVKEYRKILSLIFQILISITVAFLIIYWPLHEARLRSKNT